MKLITSENLYTNDHAAQTWRELTGKQTVEDWVQFFSSVSLTPKAPSELVTLFEVAKGAIIYSLLFYPLATIGAEQCYRVVEAGASIRCDQLGGKLKSFEKNIEFLAAQYSRVDKRRWHAVRSLRNSASHPKHQTFLDPGAAAGSLRLAAEFLNDLFE